MKLDSAGETWVLAPDAIIRCHGGKVRLHTGAAHKIWIGDDLQVAAVLLRFAQPLSVVMLLEDIAGEKRASVVKALQDWQRIGALVPASNHLKAWERSHPPTDSGDLAGSEPLPHGPPPGALIGPLADAVQAIAGSIDAFGDAVHVAGRVGDEVSVTDRLTAIVAGATALQADLDAQRLQYVAEQLSRLGITAATLNLSLHLGCGGTRFDGWVNIDASPAELALDLRWGLPFGDGSAERVYLCHVLEHLYYPEETAPLLRDLRRVVSDTGRVRIVVPDIGRSIQAYVDGDLDYLAARRETCPWWPEVRTRLEGFLTYAGAGPRVSHFMEGHKFGYDEETLIYALREAGFTQVVRCDYMQSVDPLLRVDDASAVAAGEGQHYSLFVEAAP